VFSGDESLGVKSPATEDINSGGAFCAPTEGISFTIVEFVFVICGFKGFSVWILRCSSAVECSFAFPGPAIRRGVVDIALVTAIEGRTARNMSLTEDMVFGVKSSSICLRNKLLINSRSKSEVAPKCLMRHDPARVTPTAAKNNPSLF
jgi:hypothetical protein